MTQLINRKTCPKCRTVNHSINLECGNCRHFFSDMIIETETTFTKEDLTDAISSLNTLNRDQQFSISKEEIEGKLLKELNL
jgi:hypothetical protein